MSIDSGIIIDAESKKIIVSGEFFKILENKRIFLSLKRFSPEIGDKKIYISFEEEDFKNKLIKLIEEIFEKYQLNFIFTDRVKNLFSDYEREKENFEEFSSNAKKIRNDEFKDNPQLVGLFDDFQFVVSKKLSHRKLYDLQMLSAFHMAFSQNSCNFAVPGAGKTTIVYATYAYLKNLPIDDPRHVDKLLILGPISSFLAWEDEHIYCFGFPITSKTLIGNISKEEKFQHLYSGEPAELTLINYHNIPSLIKPLKDFLKKNKTMVVVDEAHKIKNSEGLWGSSAVEISKDAISRVILTGTPAPNGYEDLYNLYQFIYPFKFKEILKIHLPQLEDMTKNSNEQSERVKEFINHISPYFIRIKKKDLKLPPVEEETIYVEMDERQKTIYEFIEKKYTDTFKEDNDGLKSTFNKAKLIRLRQAAINVNLLSFAIEETLPEEEDKHIDYSKLPDVLQEDFQIALLIKEYNEVIPPKFLKTLEIVKDKILPNSGKVIIWTIFIQNAKKIQDFLELNGINSKLLIGEIEPDERKKIIREFNNPDSNSFQVVIANPFSVAESISLHKGCHNAIYMERDYNCSNFLQSKDRIHRVGLNPNQVTNYYYLVTKDSIDEVIDIRLQEKIKRMEAIIDSDIPLFSRIDNDDETDIIKDILRKYARRN